jgi:hypothetical protein
MVFRYSRLCGTPSNTVNAVRSASPACWVEAESEAQRVSNLIVVVKKRSGIQTFFSLNIIMVSGEKIQIDRIPLI